MRHGFTNAGWTLAAVLGASLAAAAAPVQTAAPSPLKALLPPATEWKAVEAARSYDPASLFEYIDGAAEAYIGYDFKELLVADYQHASSKATLTAELYDMGTALNAFGIYGAERYPQSRFLPIGVQGYLEEGALNFLAGRYYVKLMCYEAGDKAGALLMSYAGALASRIKDPGAFPGILRAFADEGLVANSEKYVARNFMGFKFLSRGFTAAFKRDGQEFEAFVVDSRTTDEAGATLKLLADHFAAAGRVETSGPGFKTKDAYLKNVFVAVSGRRLCGVTKIKDGGEATGWKALESLIKALAGI
jgi:hypothetical protein